MDEQVNAYDTTSSSEWDAYTKYRPKYPSQLFDRVFAFHQSHGGAFHAAHDAGCGPGITAAVLSQRFQRVICSDYSANAVEAAKNILTEFSRENNLQTEWTFRQSAAEDMAAWIAPDSLDMVTMSECLHWTDTAKTMAAVAKVLKPGGTFAVWYYSNAIFPDNQRVQTLFSETLEHWCQLRAEFSEASNRTLWIEQTGYDCIAFPESEGWDVGTLRLKLNTGGSYDLWIRSKLHAFMRYPKQIGTNDVLEFVEDAKEWEYQFDLDWFRGWFESLFPRMNDEYLNSQLGKLEEALGGPKEKTRAIWPLSMILARKKKEKEIE
jgi:SAM-dependent methyltransferase